MKLHPSAIQLLHDYLHRLSFAQALPPGSKTCHLMLFGRRFDLRICTDDSTTSRILRWIDQTRRPSQFPAWGVKQISEKVLTRLENSPVDAQRMLFLDLQLRFRQNNLFWVPIPERSRFFEQLLDYFSEAPSRRYPIYVPPLPQPSGGPRDPGLGLAAGAEHFSARGSSQTSLMGDSGRAARQLSSSRHSKPCLRCPTC